MESSRALIVGGSVMLAGFALYLFWKRSSSIAVVKVDTSKMDALFPSGKPASHLLLNLFEMACQSFGGLTADQKVSQQVAATLYALFKQTKEGDADDFENNEKRAPGPKYGVWLQQKGKGETQCMKEYICLVAELDPHFNETVRNVA